MQLKVKGFLRNQASSFFVSDDDVVENGAENGEDLILLDRGMTPFVNEVIALRIIVWEVLTNRKPNWKANYIDPRQGLKSLNGFICNQYLLLY